MLGEFELVKKKIAYMAAHAFAMEATTTQCALHRPRRRGLHAGNRHAQGVVHRALWQIVNDTIQIYGGQAFFTDEPYERMLRDARLNQIGEGANDVLRAFIALVGMRGVGEHLQGVLSAIKHPFKDFGTLWKFGREQVQSWLTTPEVPVQSASLRLEARELGNASAILARRCKRCCGSTARPFWSGSISKSASRRLPASYTRAAGTLSRLDHLLTHGNGNPRELDREISAGRYFLRLSNRRIQQQLALLAENDDAQTTLAANVALAGY